MRIYVLKCFFILKIRAYFFLHFKQGWFNIEEANLEVYNFSKLRKFFCRINFMMEDALRDFLYRSVVDYVDTVRRYCPESIVVNANDSVDIVGGSKLPLFIVDLKFVNASGLTNPAKFVYSASPESLADALMNPFDQIFDQLRGIIKIERRVMKKLFWAFDPTIRVPHAGEEWVIALRAQLAADVSQALQPMADYLTMLTGFMDLISIDINSYAVDAEAKFCPGETMNLPDLCALARKHALDAEAVAHMLPSNLNLGLVMVDCKSVKIMLAGKHKAIAAKLFEVLERKAREYAESLINDFRVMFDRLAVSPVDIETVTEMREFIGTLPQGIDQLGDRIIKNDGHFALMESAKWQIPMEQMDVRWDVFRWPGKMYAEIAKQEKNMRVLEYNFKRTMEEEQADFKSDIQNLQQQVAKLKELTQLSAAAKNAETVRRIQTSLQQADERGRLFNSREQLFNAPMTEYGELADLTKVFEPFFDLWDCAEKWLNNKENWTNGAFMQLDSEVVESSVTTLLRNLAKSAKTFERLNLAQCNVIAAQVSSIFTDFSFVDLPIFQFVNFLLIIIVCSAGP